MGEITSRPFTFTEEQILRVQVRTLRPGQIFRIDFGKKYPPMDYKLIYVNECRAYVEPLRRGKDIDILDSSPGGRVSIAPACECEIIDQELEAMMKSDTAPAATTKSATATKPAKTRVSGDRKFEPKKQERPVREETIRAKLLAAIESGKTDINKLMKEFGMGRSLLIAHVHEMWKCHGYGYSVVGDTVKIVKPVGGVVKQAAAAPVKKKKAKATEKDPLDADEEDPLA
jgi:hypothetical protein